ncbi:MAG: DUF4114 domain-containing protein [Candidatus Eisenbacteria bacterium]|nr:DUF4114 domain-containing protein [Candidatus Eisenbacteria bacterium]
MNRWLLLVACVLLLAAARPAAAFPVVWGASWDGPNNELQKIVDAKYGVGAINVQTDYLGYHAGDPDPWYWVDGGFEALIIKEVAGNANSNYVGWYKETGSMPVIDGIDDGLVFTGPANASNPPVFIALGAAQHFGFYMNPNGTYGAVNAPEPEKFFTNRFYNDRGPSGAGALHAPFDGDVQALVFDISRLRGPNTWLVCFEDLDTGANIGPCCAATDNDFNDFLFEVTAVGVTPALRLSMGALKIRYR